MEYKDYYRILGVPKTASKAEIKKAYRKLARQHHPDVKPGDKKAEQTFKDLNEAHTVLSDPDRRTRYDTLGPNWDAYGPPRADGGRPGGGPAAGGSPFGGFGDLGGRNVRYEFRTSGDGGDLGGFSDFFRMMFGGANEPGTTRRGGRAGTATADFDDLFGQLRNESGSTSSGRHRETPSAAPPPVEATAEISIEEAFHGTTRLVQIDDKRLEVTIPKGVDTGSRIRLKGQAGDGRDLYVVIRLRPNPVFTRRGADLERELPITLRDALLGGKVQVTTLKGRVLLTIPEGTQSGRTFRLTGQGMPRFNADGSGDLYARVRVVLPTNLSDEAKEAARRFLDLVPQPDPR